MSKTKLLKKQPRHQQKGAGMMEVLIALLVLSIGILGLATLQSIGLKYNHQSYQRTQAILQIYDMADRIRSNSPGMATAYNNLANTGPAPTTLSVDCAVAGTPCTSAQRATYDYDSWRQSLAANLGPDARGSVLRQNAQIHAIRVNWTENDVPKTFIYEAQL